MPESISRLYAKELAHVERKVVQVPKAGLPDLALDILLSDKVATTTSALGAKGKADPSVMNLVEEIYRLNVMDSRNDSVGADDDEMEGVVLQPPVWMMPRCFQKDGALRYAKPLPASRASDENINIK